MFISHLFHYFTTLLAIKLFLTYHIWSSIRGLLEWQYQHVVKEGEFDAFLFVKVMQYLKTAFYLIKVSSPLIIWIFFWLPVPLKIIRKHQNQLFFPVG